MRYIVKPPKRGFLMRFLFEKTIKQWIMWLLSLVLIIATKLIECLPILMDSELHVTKNTMILSH